MSFLIKVVKTREHCQTSFSRLFVMRALLLLPAFLFLLTGCLDKREVQKIEDSSQDQELKIKESEDLKTSEEDPILKILKKETEKINLDDSQIDELIKQTGSSALEVIDDCIDSQKSKGLPIYECTKLLKP